MDASRWYDVLQYVLAQPWPGVHKQQVMAGWGKVVGWTLDAGNASLLAASGWD